MINHNIIITYSPILLKGIGETLTLALVSLISGFLLASFFVAIKICKLKISIFFELLLNLLRSLPEILTLFAIYFGGGIILSKLFGKPIEISSFLAALLSLSLIFSAYATNILFNAYQKIARGEIEAAKIIGFNQYQILLYIILPKIFRFSIHGLGNLWLILLKDTALISLIGGNDLLSRTQIIIRNTDQPFTFYFILSAIYLVMTFITEFYKSRIKNYV